jgi:hypothetical protein
LSGGFFSRRSLVEAQEVATGFDSVEGPNGVVEVALQSFWHGVLEVVIEPFEFEAQGDLSDGFKGFSG